MIRDHTIDYIAHTVQQGLFTIFTIIIKQVFLLDIHFIQPVPKKNKINNNSLCVFIIYASFTLFLLIILMCVSAVIIISDGHFC